MNGLTYRNAEIPVDEIAVTWKNADGTTFNRYRDATKDPEAVKTLADSIATSGLAQPIVCIRYGDEFRLVAGGYRVAAHKLLGMQTIRASVAYPKGEWDDTLLRLVEIDENLVRKELDAAQRAKLTTERAKLVKNTVGKTNGIKGSATKTTTGVREVARITGRDVKEVYKDIKRGTNIATDVLDAVSGTTLSKGVVLDKLAEMPVEKQREAVAPLVKVKLGKAHVNTVEFKGKEVIGIGVSAGGKKLRDETPRVTAPMILTAGEAERAKAASDKAAAEAQTKAAIDAASRNAQTASDAKKKKDAPLTTTKAAVGHLNKLPGDIRRFALKPHPELRGEVVAALKRIVSAATLALKANGGDDDAE